MIEQSVNRSRNLIFTGNKHTRQVTVNLIRIFVTMRAWFGYILVFLTGILGAALPALASSAKTTQPATVTVTQASAVEQSGRSQHWNQLEDTEAITATCSQSLIYGHVVSVMSAGFYAVSYPFTNTPLPVGRHNARIQPFFRLILFPFHGFW